MNSNIAINFNASIKLEQFHEKIITDRKNNNNDIANDVEYMEIDEMNNMEHMNIATMNNSIVEHMDVDEIDLINENKYKIFNMNEQECDNFRKKLSQYTMSLSSIIPWEESNFVFSGGLLYDIIIDRYNENLSDIDLFFYGSIESKITTINKLLDNLDKNEYNYLIGKKNSVINIFIQGIPRMIQLIMTDKTNPESIIDEFDLNHVKSYTDGDKLYCSTEFLNYFKTHETQYIPHIHKNRIIKYFERGIIKHNILFDNKYHNWILKKQDTENYLSEKMQKNIYKKTQNLTKYLNGTQIDFNKFISNQLDLNDIFNCTINYNKTFNNRNFVENMDMFGKFTDYFNKTKYEILKSSSIYEKSVSMTTDIYNCNYIHDVNKKYMYEKNKFYQLHMYNKENMCESDNYAVYCSCEFIKFEKITENNEKIIKIYFKVQNDNVIEYLKKKLNMNLINSSLIISFLHHKYFNNRIKIASNINNITSSIVSDENNEFIVCSKLYESDIEEFINLNGQNILNDLNNLESSKQVHCLFKIDIFSLKQDHTIKHLDVNLNLKYIFIK